MRVFTFTDSEIEHLKAALRVYADRLALDGFKRLPLGLKQFAATLDTSNFQPEDMEAASVADSPILLYDVGAVADALSLSKRTVGRLITDGHIPSVKIGAARRVHRDDLLAYTNGLRQ